MEECPHLVRDHDVWKDKGGRHVHGGLLVFWFVPVSLLVFLHTENGEKKEKQMGEFA